VTGGARDVAIAAQDLVEEQRATERHLRRILRRHRADRNDTPVADAGPELGIERRLEGRVGRRGALLASREGDRSQEQPQRYPRHGEHAPSGSHRNGNEIAT
jgi:hypothetical protein